MVVTAGKRSPHRRTSRDKRYVRRNERSLKPDTRLRSQPMEASQRLPLLHHQVCHSRYVARQQVVKHYKYEHYEGVRDWQAAWEALASKYSSRETRRSCREEFSNFQNVTKAGPRGLLFQDKRTPKALPRHGGADLRRRIPGYCSTTSSITATTSSGTTKWTATIT